MPLDIRRARTLAEPWLPELLNAFQREIGEPTMPAEKAPRLDQAIRAGEIVFLIAYLEETAVGMCSLTFGFSTYRTARFALLDDFYVVPEQRGRGVARSLIERAQAESRASDCASVLLGCSPGDRPKYEHFGFGGLGELMAFNL